MLKPLSDHIILEAVKEEKKKGGIILPETVKEEKSEIGKVVAVGPGKLNEAGKRVAMDIKKGQTVVFKKYSDHKIKIKDTEYIIVTENDVLAIID